MPTKSEAQRKYLNAKFGHKWVKKHHFDNTDDLPARARKIRRGKKRKFSQPAAIQRSTGGARDFPIRRSVPTLGIRG